jgi:MtN3 and saliva related transmembrane protein
MNPVTLLGLVAAALTTFSLVPQVVKTIRTRETGDLSLGMYALYATGILLWLIYGVLQADLPLIASNSVTFALSAWILVMKIRFG